MISPAEQHLELVKMALEVMPLMVILPSEPGYLCQASDIRFPALETTLGEGTCEEAAAVVIGFPTINGLGRGGLCGRHMALMWMNVGEIQGT